MLLFQWKMEAKAISLIHSSFSHHANGSLSFVRLFTKKETEVLRLQTDKMDLPTYAYIIKALNFC
jgi:glycyl-tRNA synthetase alpha subunit